jgi:hypothetical protein
MSGTGKMYLSAKEKEFIIKSWKENPSYDDVIQKFQRHRKKNPERFHLVTKESIDQAVKTNSTYYEDEANKTPLETWTELYDNALLSTQQLRDETHDMLYQPNHYSIHDKCFEDCNRVIAEMTAAPPSSLSQATADLATKVQTLQEVLATLRPESPLSIMYMRRKLLDSFKVNFSGDGSGANSSSAAASSAAFAALSPVSPVAALAAVASNATPLALPASDADLAADVAATMSANTTINKQGKVVMKRKRISSASLAALAKEEGLDVDETEGGFGGGHAGTMDYEGEDGERQYLEKTHQATKAFLKDMTDEEKVSYAGDSKRKRMKGLVSAIEHLVIVQNIFDESKENIVKARMANTSTRVYDPYQAANAASASASATSTSGTGVVGSGNSETGGLDTVTGGGHTAALVSAANAVAQADGGESVSSDSSVESAIHHEVPIEERLQEYDEDISRLTKELALRLRERSLLKPYALDKEKSCGLAILSSDITQQSLNVRVNITEDYATMMHELFHAGLPKKLLYSMRNRTSTVLAGTNVVVGGHANPSIDKSKILFLQPGKKNFSKKALAGHGSNLDDF